MKESEDCTTSSDNIKRAKTKRETDNKLFKKYLIYLLLFLVSVILSLLLVFFIVSEMS